jgi:hypothetical protein
LRPLCFHFIIAFHRVFFLSLPSFPGRRRPTCNLSRHGINHRSPPTANRQILITWMIRFDSFFLQFDSLASKILCVLCALYVFHFIIAFHCVFFSPSIFLGSAQADLVPFAAAVLTAGFIYLRVLCTLYVFHFINAFHRVLLPPPFFLGRCRPTLCFPQTRFQPPGYGYHISLVFFFLPPPFFLGRRRPTLCPSQPRFQPLLTTTHQPPNAHCLDDSFRFVFFNSNHLLSKFLVSFAPFMFSFHHCFPSCFSFSHLRLSQVGAGRPCALRRRGFNRCSPPTTNHSLLTSPPR